MLIDDSKFITDSVSSNVLQTADIENDAPLISMSLQKKTLRFYDTSGNHSLGFNKN